MNKSPFLFLLTLWVLFPSKSFSQFEEEEDNRILNQFIVMLKPEHSTEELLKDFPSINIKESLAPRLNIYLVERNTLSSPAEFLVALKRNEHVKLAQFNHHLKERSLVPNDSYFNFQWNMLNTGQNGGRAGADIDAVDAWDINTDNITADGDSVVVAIVDGTFDIFHPDLNYFVNYNEIDSNGVDDDGNTYIDDRRGWSVALNNGNVYDTTDPHSTHLAGIVGAKGNNNLGVAGVCWGVKILPVNRRSNIESDVVAAYNYVYTMRYLYNNTFGTKGAFIVATNSSFGVNNGNPVDYPIWCAMYDWLGSLGILSAAATANSNINVDVAHDMPTACPSKWMIAVTNTTRHDLINTTQGAAYGATTIDIGAPGTAIYSTTPLNSYGYITGTSMAAPHVAGTIAAMYSAACKGLIDAYHEYPDSIALLIKNYLLDGAEWNSSLNTLTVTNGRLNLFRAISNLRRFNCDSCKFNIAIGKVPISCKQSNDGALAVTVDSGSIFDYNILWSNGPTSPEVLSMVPGFYTVTVRDTATNCRRFATAELHNPDTILISAINIHAADSVTPGNITIVASAGHDPLLYSLDGTNYQQTATFSVPVNGTYTVYIRNSSGCVVQQSVVVSDVDELLNSDFGFRIFPNPANDQLNIYSSIAENSPLEVYDVSGRKIYESAASLVSRPSPSSLTISTSNFSPGVYLLRFRNTTRRFVVMH
jgi:hypothetical protein